MTGSCSKKFAAKQRMVNRLHAIDSIYRPLTVVDCMALHVATERQIKALL